jgi:drug/metabolite transporter (DMT)-like permease
VKQAGEVDSSTVSAAQSRDNLWGLIAMIIAVGALSFMDAGLKALAPHYSPLQVASIRGLSTLPIVLVWVALSGGFAQLRSVRFGLHVVRGVLGIGMLATFTYGVRHLPLSDAYSIFFIAPLVITALAAVILGERVGWHRWTAIGIGFAGVLVVLRPAGAGTLTTPGLAVVATAIGYALSAITVRVLGRTDTTQSMVFWLMTLVGAGAGLLALPVWRPIQSEHWLVIGGIAVTGSLGQWAITEAFRRGEPSFIAPFEYTALAWGIGLDWYLWKTTPAAFTLLGAALIILSGLYLLRRERVHIEAEHP